MKALEITLAAVGGAIVGAAAAILLAPQEGKRTRKQLREFVRAKCPFIKESEVERVANQIEEEIGEKINEALETANSKKK